MGKWRLTEVEDSNDQKRLPFSPMKIESWRAPSGCFGAALAWCKVLQCEDVPQVDIAIIPQLIHNCDTPGSWGSIFENFIISMKMSKSSPWKNHLGHFFGFTKMDEFHGGRRCFFPIKSLWCHQVVTVETRHLEARKRCGFHPTSAWNSSCPVAFWGKRWWWCRRHGIFNFAIWCHDMSWYHIYIYIRLWMIIMSLIFIIWCYACHLYIILYYIICILSYYRSIWCSAKTYDTVVLISTPTPKHHQKNSKTWHLCVCFSLSKPGGGHRSLQSQSGTIGGRGSRERRLSLLVSLQMGEAKGLGHFAACILWGRGRKMFDGRFVVIVFIFNTLED